MNVQRSRYVRVERSTSTTASSGTLRSLQSPNLTSKWVAVWRVMNYTKTASMQCSSGILKFYYTMTVLPHRSA